MNNYFFLSEKDVVGDERLNIFADDTMFFGDDKWWLNKPLKNILAPVMSNKNRKVSKASTINKNIGVRLATYYDGIKDESIFIKDIDEYRSLVYYGVYLHCYTESEANLLLNIIDGSSFVERLGENVFKFQGSLFYKSSSTGIWILSKPIRWMIDKQSNIAVMYDIINGMGLDYNDLSLTLDNGFDNLINNEIYKRYIPVINETMEKQRKRNK